MITNLLLMFFQAIIGFIVWVLPKWSIYPQAFTDGLQYFFTSLGRFNFILPMDTLLTVLLFVINFEIIYYTAKIIIRAINFLRGAGELKI